MGKALLVQGMEHIPVPWGGDPSRPGDEGVRIFDVSDPTSPSLLGHWRTGDNGVHRNHYTGGRYVHCAAHQPGFDGNIYVILDISDPAAPVVAGRWFVPEQFTGAGSRSGPRISLHGPAYGSTRTSSPTTGTPSMTGASQGACPVRTSCRGSVSVT